MLFVCQWTIYFLTITIVYALLIELFIKENCFCIIEYFCTAFSHIVRKPFSKLISINILFQFHRMSWMLFKCHWNVLQCQLTYENDNRPISIVIISVLVNNISLFGDNYTNKPIFWFWCTIEWWKVSHIISLCNYCFLLIKIFPNFQHFSSSSLNESSK